MSANAIHITAGDPVGRVSHLDVQSLLARVRRDHFGFLLESYIGLLAGHPEGRLTQVLVRCGSCRFTCSVKDVAHLERAIVSVGDYVRDISIPVWTR